MTTESPSHRIRYTDGVTYVVLTVPWGWGTGQIPPPSITFVLSAGGVREFVYDGDAT